MNHSKYDMVKLAVEGRDMDFPLAKRLSEVLATGLVTDPMLVAWFDGEKNEEHPRVPECQHKPGWIAYAEGHGGRVQVDVNEGQYRLIFADAGVVQE